jgi:membrane-associated phospholipid phosphatase
LNRQKSFAAGILVLCLVTGNATAQTQDTIHTEPKPLFQLRDAGMVGAFTLATIALAPIDRRFTGELREGEHQSNTVLRRGATAFRLFGVPGTLYASAGFYLLGLASGHRRTEDLGLHTMEAIGISMVEVEAIKMAAGRARPRVSPNNARNFQLFRGISDDNYKSFPSGHTTIAFAFASAVASETQRWWPDSRWIIGPLVYSSAALTGVSRIYNNDHWASDVMAGAALGTFTGLKVIRYMHSHPDNAIDRKLLRAGVDISNDGRWMPVLSVSFR